MVNRSVTAFLLFFCLLSSNVNCPDPGVIDRVADLVVKMVCDSEDTLITSVITCAKTPGGRSRSRSPSTKKSRWWSLVFKRGSSKERKSANRQTFASVKRVGDQPYDIRHGENGLIVFAEVNPSGAPMHEGKRLVEIVQVARQTTPIVNTIEVAIKYQSGDWTEERRVAITETEMRNAMILAEGGFGPAVILARRTDSLKPLLPKAFLMVKRVKGVTLGELFNHILDNAYKGPVHGTPALLTTKESIRSSIAALQILELQRVVLERVKELISNTQYRHCDVNWGNIMFEQQAETQDLPVTTATDLDSVLQWKSKNIIFRPSSENSDVKIILDPANVQFIDPYFLEQVPAHVPGDPFYPCVNKQTRKQQSDVWNAGLQTDPEYANPLKMLPHGRILKFINELFPPDKELLSVRREKELVDIMIGSLTFQQKMRTAVLKSEHRNLSPKRVVELVLKEF